jgi:hypothetical protein
MVADGDARDPAMPLLRAIVSLGDRGILIPVGIWYA